MNKVDLNNETVFKIVESAIELFNINGYAGTSISDISKRAGLSKGILYHYFKNKDELYLFCVKLCIEEYAKYLNDNLLNPISQSDAIAENVKVRIQFFNQYPQYKTLFNYIVARKPSHLAKELVDIRQTLVESNINRLETLIGNVNLGKGIEKSDIIAFTAIIQNSSSFLLQDGFDEEKRNEQIATVVRLTKIFINGLKEDVV